MNAVDELTPGTEPRIEGPKAEFLAWFQNAPAGLALCDTRGRVMAMNSAMERLLGGTQANGTDRIFDALEGGGSELVAELLAGKRNSVQMEYPAEENSKPVQWALWRVVYCDGSAYLMASAEAHKWMQQPRPADNLEVLGRVTGGVAHDFNNLLTGVLLYSDLLLATLNPDDRARRYAEEIRKAGLEASDLVRQLLSVAKPVGPVTQSFSLNETAENMRNFLSRMMGENIELKLSLDPNLGLVQMNAAKAQQILLNLALNARDAMPRGGTITVETTDCKIEMLGKSSFNKTCRFRCALLVVADEGEGMDLDTRAHLFEPFFTTKGRKGTGLGLTTVRDIVSSYGGLIHVESAAGRGTRFSVLLPVLSELPSPPFDREGFRPAESGKAYSSNEEE